MCNEQVKNKRIGLSPEIMKPGSGSSANYRTHPNKKTEINYGNIIGQQIQTFNNTGFGQRTGQRRNQ